LAPEAIAQAMALISDHVPADTRRRKRAQTTSTTIASDPSDSGDDFDLSAYQSAMNSDIAKQAQQLQRRTQIPTTICEPEKILLVFQGQKRGTEEVSETWGTVLGLKVLSTTTFTKMQEQFKKSKGFSKDVVFSWRGVRLWHGGTPQKLRMTDQERIGMIFGVY
jgi:hypothetical protein